MPSDAFDVYTNWLCGRGHSDREVEISHAKEDLLSDARNSPDYQPEAMRNGTNQPMIFTRGGEEHSYNIVCMPDDELYAGDEIDVFGNKWIVMEGRADDTTHKTGRMYQCNYHMRFHVPGSSELFERNCYLKASGYSSSLTGTNAVQTSEEQFAIYVSYDEITARIYVDQRLAAHVAYDEHGDKILSCFRVTGVNAVSNSYDQNDHLLCIKVVRGLYSRSHDSVDLCVCDHYTYDQQEEHMPNDVPPAMLHCEISGGKSVRIGSSRVYRPIFYSVSGEVVNGVVPSWSASNSNGCSLNVRDDGTCLLTVPNVDELIGHMVVLTLADADGLYSPCEIEVEVRNIV